jgi:hypothetical protein
VVDLEFSVYNCTFHLVLYPLSDDTWGESNLTDRLRLAKALHYQEYAPEDEHDEMFDASSYRSGLPDEGTQMNQLRSVVMQDRKPRAGRRLLMQLLVAVVIGIIVGLVIAGAVS